MTVFTHIAGDWMPRRLAERYGAVVAENACPEDCVMIKGDNQPVCRIRVAALAGVEAQDMTCGFARSQNAVMTG